MESWQKWSFPFNPLHQDSDDLAHWRPVRKRRRISRFSRTSGPAAAHAPSLGQESRCEVELTEIRTSGQDWWTLGFEATGPASLLRGELQATAALVFAQAAQARPGSVEPGLNASMSYAEWLCRRPGGKNDALRLPLCRPAGLPFCPPRPAPARRGTGTVPRDQAALPA
jgi:hypothetical protein